MKRILRLLDNGWKRAFCAALSLLLFGSAEVRATVSWEDAYLNFLLVTDINVEPYLWSSVEHANYFIIYDIDKDNIPELIVDNKAYTHSQNEMVYLGEAPAPFNDFFYAPPGNMPGIYSDVGYKGQNGTVSYHTVVNGALTEETVLLYDNHRQGGGPSEERASFIAGNNLTEIDYYEIGEAGYAECVSDYYERAAIPAAPAQRPAWYERYLSVITDSLDLDFGVNLIDLNNDSIPELLYTDMAGHEGGGWSYLYFMRSGAVVRMEPFAGGYCVSQPEGEAALYKWTYEGPGEGGSYWLPSAYRLELDGDGAEFVPIFAFETPSGRDDYSETTPFYEYCGEIGMAVYDVMNLWDSGPSRESNVYFQSFLSWLDSKLVFFHYDGSSRTRLTAAQYLKETNEFLNGLKSVELDSAVNLVTWGDEPLTRASAVEFLDSYMRNNILPYPPYDPGEEKIRAIGDAIGGMLDGKIARLYKLADDLYYVVLTLYSGSEGGAVVREGRKDGERIYFVEMAEPVLLTAEELSPYIEKAAKTPNIAFDYGVVSKFKTLKEYTDYLEEGLKNVDGTAPNGAALREIASYVQNAVSEGAVSVLKAAGNRLFVTEKDAEEAVSSARQSYDRLMEVLERGGVKLNKPVSIIIRIEGQNLDWGKAISATLDAPLADTLGDGSIMLLLGDNRHAVTISGGDTAKLIEQYGAFTIQIERTGEGAYTLVFIDENENILSKLPVSVAVTLPAKGMFDTVFASYEGGRDNWGGQYDEIGGTIQFKTPFSGTYEVMENIPDIPDITELPEEMRKAISFMVSKGFFELKGEEFNPAGKLSRYDFSSTLARMFFALDRSLKTSFTDVPEDISYYPFIASGEYAGIIEGVGEGLFAGERVMTRQEAVAVAARLLRVKKGYAPPAEPEEYLSAFSDSYDIADWARGDVALAVREGVVGMGGSFAPNRDITRGEAAVIMYRLFMLLYETPPLAIRMEPAADTAEEQTEPAEPEDGEDEAPAETGEEENTFPTLPAVLGGIGALGIIGGVVFINRRKLFKGKNSPPAP